MEFTYTIEGLEALTRNLDDLAMNQLPFGTALALSRIAQDAQAEIQRQLPQRFIIRTGWWRQNTPFGIKTINATKDSQQAAVYTVAPFMMLQETGGMRVTHTGRKFLAIPTTNVRRYKSQLISKAQYPLALQATGRAFIAKMKSGKLGIWIRTGRGRLPIVLMYSLVEEAKIKPGWEFIDTGIKVVEDRWIRQWDLAMQQALRTAR